MPGYQAPLVPQRAQALRGKFDRSAGPSAEFFRSPMTIGLPCSLIN